MPALRRRPDWRSGVRRGGARPRRPPVEIHFDAPPPRVRKRADSLPHGIDVLAELALRKVPRVERPHEEDQQGLDRVELAVLGHPQVFAVEHVVVDGPVEEGLARQAQDLAQRAESDAHRGAVAGEHVHQVRVQILVATLVVVPPAVTIGAVEVRRGDAEHHRTIADDGQIETRAVPGHEPRRLEFLRHEPEEPFDVAPLVHRCAAKRADGHLPRLWVERRGADADHTVPRELRVLAAPAGLFEAQAHHFMHDLRVAARDPEQASADVRIGDRLDVERNDRPVEHDAP